MVRGSGDQLLTERCGSLVCFRTLIQRFAPSDRAKDRADPFVEVSFTQKMRRKILLILYDELQALLSGFFFAVSFLSELVEDRSAPASNATVFDLAIEQEFLANFCEHLR